MKFSENQYQTLVWYDMDQGMKQQFRDILSHDLQIIVFYMLNNFLNATYSFLIDFFIIIIFFYQHRNIRTSVSLT